MKPTGIAIMTTTKTATVTTAVNEPFGRGVVEVEPTASLSPTATILSSTAGLETLTLGGMCRNIRTLHNFEPPATHDEAHAASLQYVRKVSGATKPSQANAAAFDRAVEEITAITERLLDELTSTAPPKNREDEAAKARARAAERYAS
jgi:hypothetical protein